jgi:hypothetical protein
MMAVNRSSIEAGVSLNAAVIGTPVALTRIRST